MTDWPILDLNRRRQHARQVIALLLRALQGLAGPKLHIWDFERTQPVHFMGLTAADTKQRSRLAS